MTCRRAIVLVTEGATPELLDRWRDSLPGFARLRREGAWGRMESEFVPYEPSGLTSAFTGYEPSSHGVFSYWDIHSHNYEPNVLDSGSLERLPLWHRPELNDVVSSVINVFGTHPIRPFNGTCVSYPMRRTLHACHPRSLPVDLGRIGLRPIHDATVWFSGQPKEEFVRPVLEADRARADIALQLFDTGLGEAPDLLVLNLTAIDRLSHIYWQELEPDSPVPEGEQAVYQAYALADRVLGQLLDRADEHTEVLAFSEIGFGPLRAYQSVNEVLAEAGLLAFGSDGRPSWADTRAFEAVQGSHGVNLNLSGRYKHGSVDVGQAKETAERVREALLAHTNPLTGTPLVAEVLDREEVYSGPFSHHAPDLILVPHDWRYLPLGDQFWASRVYRTLQSGWHRRGSYWGGLGASFQRGHGRDGVLTDVIPTIVRMLGRPSLEDLTGTPLGSRDRKE